MPSSVLGCRFYYLSVMALIDDLFADMEDNLLANMDIQGLKESPKWFNTGERHTFANTSNSFVLLGKLAGPMEGSKLGVQGDKLPLGREFVSNSLS